jgi:pyruvate kinase
MRRNRRVKIVATLGPASTNEETMRRLFEAGADVFRVNMSHATHDGLREVHAIVRKLESEFSRPIGILVDLQGPKLRIGKLDSGSMRLTKGDVSASSCLCYAPGKSRYPFRSSPDGDRRSGRRSCNEPGILRPARELTHSSAGVR